MARMPPRRTSRSYFGVIIVNSVMFFCERVSLQLLNIREVPSVMEQGGGDVRSGFPRKYNWWQIPMTT